MITVSNDAIESEQVEFMRGKIASGLGQAQYFLTREGYSRQFQERLGFLPFPGTLNVRLEEPFPTKLQAIKIEGFSEEEATLARADATESSRTESRRWRPSGPGRRGSMAGGLRRGFLSGIPCSPFARL